MPLSPDATRGVICVDLDGPILDVSERYFRVHRSIAQDAGCATSEKTDYWDRRREHMPLSELLARCCPGIDPHAYRRAWFSRIEAPEFLGLDAIVPDLPFLPALVKGGVHG